MNYHIVLSIPFDLEDIHHQAEAGKRPRHAMWGLGQKLQATIHQPNPKHKAIFDRILALVCSSQPEQWALARHLAATLTENDTVFCVGEDVGVPLALLCNGKPNRPKIVVKIMAPERLRVRTLLSLFKLDNVIDLFLTNTQIKADTLQKNLNIDDARIYVLPEQTDARFFTPGVAKSAPLFKPGVAKSETRALIASAGREQRDYQTLAAAIQDMDVDVDVCALSPNASRGTQVAFPDTIPNNMSFNPHDWPEFRQMYRNSDLVVVSLLDNHYSAGLTVLMEAMACQRPVLITRTPGLAEKLIDKGIVAGVDPGDVVGMRKTIQYYLNHPEEAETLAKKGYQYFQTEHTSELFINRLADKMYQVTENTMAVLGSTCA